MRREIIVSAENWFKYLRALKEINPFHKDMDEAVELFGVDLEELGVKKDENGKYQIFAPGMWVGSHIQGDNPIYSIRRISFSDFIYDQDKLVLSDSIDERRGLINYVFQRGGNPVCKVEGVNYEAGPEKLVLPDGEPVHVYNRSFSLMDYEEFLDSIGLRDIEGSHLEMMFSSLSAPALLDYGIPKKVIGTHVSQSFEVHHPLSLGDVNIGVYGCDIREGLGRKMPISYDLVWSQRGREVATGKARVKPMSMVV